MSASRLIILTVMIMAIYMQISIAQNNYYLKAGLNTAKFRTEKIVSQRGITIGGGYDFHVSKIKNSFIAVELLYTTKKALLEDRTWPNGLYTYTAVVSGDLLLDFHYIEIPLKCGYQINFSEENDSNVKLFSGFTWNIQLVNKLSSENEKDTFMSDEEIKKFPFDYYLVDLDESSDFIPNLTRPFRLSTLDYIFGIQININLLNWEFRYSKAINETKEFTSSTLHDKIDAYTITIGYNF